MDRAHARAVLRPSPQTIRGCRHNLRAFSEKLLELRAIVEMVPDVEPEAAWIAEDPDDNWVIQCAITAQAELIVSGDKRLILLEQVDDIRILTARAFLEELGLKTQ